MTTTEQYHSESLTDRWHLQQRSSLGRERPLLSLDLSELWREEEFLCDSFLEEFREPLLEPLELVLWRWVFGGWWAVLVLTYRERLELPLRLSSRPPVATELDPAF